MNAASGPDKNAIDDGVDGEIFACLDPDKPRSFFLHAGAGSGKTRSLVTALGRVLVEYKRRLWMRGQRVAVITYTNAACDEITARVNVDTLVDVSTIHSFAWSLIGGYQVDIRAWLRRTLAEEIAELRAAQAKGRPESKAARDRARSIEDKAQRVADLDSVRKVVYSPTGDNQGRDALSHSEVIALAATFLTEKPTLQRIFVNKYPILLIDESQDTNRHLMDAFLAVQHQHEVRFCLGLFGDTMQRIYADGKVGLGEGLPSSWARPTKRMNHRCPERIIKLINRVRSDVDGRDQLVRTDKLGGTVGLFIVPSDVPSKGVVEAAIADRMVAVTGDPNWAAHRGEYKALILEHHMAARRMGFGALFEPLYAVDRFRTGLLDGSLPGMRFFAKDVHGLMEALRRGDGLAAAAVVRKVSPLLDSVVLKSVGGDQVDQIRQARVAAEELLSLWHGEAEPTFLDVLRSISASGLFVIPEALRPIAGRDPADMVANASEPEEEVDPELRAWDQVMGTPFKQITAYDQYVSGRSRFGTHQGVKGLEFPRVMVIMDDEEARGFLFSYEKLFGAKRKSETDLKNESQGGETTIDRTRRLFYVTSSRAEQSLAIVAYSKDPESVRAHVLATGWFEDNEIQLVPREFGV